MNAIQYTKDAEGIVVLLMDAPRSSANTMDKTFRDSFKAVVQQIVEEQESIKGIVLSSAKKSFFAGGDLKELVAVKKDDAQSFFQTIQDLKADMRRLETLGKPLVAAINGSALGGGWELALMCHQRICLNDQKIQLGLPEVTLGLLPGGGGVVRMVRLLGLEKALPFLAEGKQFRPLEGVEIGLVHKLVDKADDLMLAAKKWIVDNPVSQQVFDDQKYKIPGGTPSTPRLAQMLPIAPAMLRDKTKGCFPAPEAILSAAVEGAQVDVDTALRIESRYFTELASGQVAKNMINTFWFQLNALKEGHSRPDGFPPMPTKKVGILGAGMMGSGIAYACAVRGIDVVLKDVSEEAAQRGKQYSDKLLTKRVERGHMGAEKKSEIMARIHPTEAVKDLVDCDLVIEAVFEDRELKAKVTKEVEAVTGKDVLFGSNTSTLPITGLAKASSRPGNFVGLHFFSPVDKMPLVEIIRGEQSSPEALARAFDFVLQIQKTPIVVNDSRGFFTSRVFGTFTNEGMAMLSEGVHPASIENAALLAGMPVGPLAVSDEVSLGLMVHVMNQTKKDFAAEGKPWVEHPAHAVVEKMMALQRPGKAKGAGFYEYPQVGKKYLWAGLQKEFGADKIVDLQELKDRILFIQAVETVRCLEEGVLTSVKDANIGSIFGIGFAAWTGGALQFINQYGLKEFTVRAMQLAERYGDRFQPPLLLMKKAEAGEIFVD
ncbi:MAG: 3-hydroxyacyl-CoA dehydrogenase NAD-binding domain-containing protein [Oligoflexus sp.]